MPSLQDTIESITKQRDMYLDSLAIHQVALIDSAVLLSGNNNAQAASQIYQETLKYTSKNREKQVIARKKALLEEFLNDPQEKLKHSPEQNAYI